jgi:hypothetical protein
MSQASISTINWFKKPYLSTDEKGYLSTISTGFTQIKNNNFWGLIDSNGNFIIDCIADEPIIRDGLIPKKKDGKIGLINKNQKLIIPYEYESFNYLNPDFHYLEKDVTCYLVDSIGNIIQPQYQIRHFNDYSFSEGYISVEFWIDNEKTKTDRGYIDIKGQSNLPFSYVYNRPFNGGIASTAIREINGEYLWQFIDKSGNLIHTCDESWIGPNSFDGELAITQIKNKSGFALFDRNFEIVVEPKFSGYYGHFYGFYVVSIDANQGILNANGEVVLPYQYSNIRILDSSYAIVEKREFKKQYKSLNKLWDFENIISKSGVYDLKNKQFIIEPKYDFLEYVNDKLLITKVNNKFGCINFREEVIFPFIFDSFQPLIDRKSWVKFEGKWGIVQY